MLQMAEEISGPGADAALFTTAVAPQPLVPRAAATLASTLVSTDGGTAIEEVNRAAAAARAPPDAIPPLLTSATTEDAEVVRRATLGLAPRGRTPAPSHRDAAPWSASQLAATADAEARAVNDLLHTLSTSLRDSQVAAALVNATLPLHRGDVITAIEPGAATAAKVAAERRATAAAAAGTPAAVRPSLAAAIPVDGRHVYVVHSGAVNTSSIPARRPGSPTPLRVPPGTPLAAALAVSPAGGGRGRGGRGALGVGGASLRRAGLTTPTATSAPHLAMSSPMLGSRVTETTTIESERAVGSVQLREIRHAATAVDAFGFLLH